MNADPELKQARERLEVAKARFHASVGTAMAKLDPGNIANDAMHGMKIKASEIAADGVAAARKRPGMVAAAVAAIGLVLARKPIARMIGDWRASDDATATENDS